MEITRKEFLETLGIGAAGSLAPSSPSAMPSQGEQAARPANPKVKHGDDLKGCTDAVADFIATDQRAAFPPDVLREAKRCLIDGFAVILAGSTLRGSAIVREYVSGFEGKEASVVGPEPLRVAAAKAALANGASGHAMDYDDTQLSTTPDPAHSFWTRLSRVSKSSAKSPRPSIPIITSGGSTRLERLVRLAQRQAPPDCSASIARTSRTCWRSRQAYPPGFVSTSDR